MVIGAFLVLCLLALLLRAGGKKSPLDRDEILRVRRFADQIRREQVLPYE